jgi:glycosyltransferase involved in cell wall biosynthesis
VNLICRAVESCLHNSLSGYEVIVVDDGSTDGTNEILRRYSTDRLHTVRLGMNKGVCSARTAGVEAAGGEWILFLDSDDELMPGALGTLEIKCRQAPPDIGRMAFMYVHDDGSTSPKPWNPGEVMDYQKYLEWSERVNNSDFSNCIRRFTFNVVRFPCGGANESIYHLDFARAFKTLCCGDVIARVHNDAPDRLTHTRKGHLRHRLLNEANTRVTALLDINDRHGEELRRFAPSRAWMFSRALISSALMAGQKRLAFRAFLNHVRRYPWSYSVWGFLGMGLISKRAVAWVVALRRGT